jgi:spermidine synthase
MPADRPTSRFGTRPRQVDGVSRAVEPVSAAEAAPPSASTAPAAAVALAVATVFVSAFLLFLVQPMVSKHILPWFGGTAAVWAVCLSFFQVALLVGYAYAHALSRWCAPSRQWGVHGTLLLLAVLNLQVLAGPEWKPGIGGAADPSAAIVALLIASVGLPYTLLAATGPLVQSWMARSGAAAGVYRLFALGNLASLGGLLVYPFGIEPRWALQAQAAAWAFAFGVYAGLVTWTGWLTRHGATVPQRLPASALPNKLPASRATAGAARPTGVWGWFSLSALGSALLVATTNHLTRDVASVPFLWIAPLVLYLLSFVLVFDSERFYRGQAAWTWVVLAAATWCAVLVPLAPIIVPPTAEQSPWPVLAASFLGCLALACVWLHGELARHKPAPAQLTRYYLVMALGGAVGGLTVSLVAPRLLPGFYELGIAYVLLAALMAWRHVRGLAAAKTARGLAARWGLASLAVCAMAIGGLCLGFKLWVDATQWRTLQRNFYGVLATGDRRLEQPANAYRVLAHGSIRHGAQYLAPERRRDATTYYTEGSGVGRAIMASRVDARSPQRVGMIGLGAGTTAVFGREGDTHRFYEINPLVLALAQSEFSFLADSRARIETVLGDARLMLEAEPPQAYDVLAVDAFSGDAVPAHLLTREALRVYRRHLAPGGVIAFHISNQHLDLAPVVGALARDAGLAVVRVRHAGPSDDISGQSADWVLVAEHASVLARAPLAGATESVSVVNGSRVWTDDFNDLWSVLKF